MRTRQTVINLRLPPALLERIDRLVEAERAGGLPSNRNDVIRRMVLDALGAAERRAGVERR